MRCSCYQVTSTYLAFQFHFFFSFSFFSKPQILKSFRNIWKRRGFVCYTVASVPTNGTRLGVDPRSSHGTERCNALCHVFGERNPYYIGWGPRFRWWTLLPFKKVPDRSRDCMLLMTFYLGIWFSQKDADLLRGLDDVFGKMCRLKPRRVCFLSPRRPVREWNGWLHFLGWDFYSQFGMLWKWTQLQSTPKFVGRQ